MAEHSPAPWTPKHGHRTTHLRGISGADGKPVVVFHGIARPTSSQGRANALLIAAAPDLLDALMSVVYVFAMNNAEPAELQRALSKQMDKASAAILKAQGKALPAEASDGIAAARPLGIGQRDEGGCRDAEQ